MHEPSVFAFESVIEKLKSRKTQCNDQISAELIKAGSRTIHSEIHELIISVWSKRELPEEWNELVIGGIYEKGEKTKQLKFWFVLMMLIYCEEACIL
jgi:hypothetical protein